MSPDDDHLEKQAAAEQMKLEKMVQALTDEDKKDIYEKGSLSSLLSYCQTRGKRQNMEMAFFFIINT